MSEKVNRLDTFNPQKTLWERIQESPNALDRYKTENGYSACVYPEPYEGSADAVLGFRCLSSGMTVFAAVSESVAATVMEDGPDDCGYEFMNWLEWEVMPYCIEHTDWGGSCGDCSRCEEEDMCLYAPFEGWGGCSWGLAEEDDFVLKNPEIKSA